jgi:thymidylate synthase
MSKYTHEDGTPFTKEEFLEKLETDTEFNNEFGNRGVDQISELIKQLKENPDSRRLMVNAWAVNDLPKMVLPPCHYGFQVYTRELSLRERNLYWFNNSGNDVFPEGDINDDNLDKLNVPKRAISLMWNQRSVDTFLGLPFNIASYGLLLEIIAKEVNMVPEELIGNLGDVHLYSNHIEQAKEQIGRERTHEEMVEIYHQIENKKDRDGYWTWETRFEDNNISKRTREPYSLPTLRIASGPLDDIAHHEIMDFDILNYQSHPAIKAPLSN